MKGEIRLHNKILALALVLSITCAGYFIAPHIDMALLNPEDPSDEISNSEERNGTYPLELKNYNFSKVVFTESFVMPPNASRVMTKVAISKLALNNSTAFALMKHYGIYNIDNMSKVQYSKEGISVINSNNTTVLGYLGYIYHENTNHQFEPIRQEDIEKNKSLYNKSQALEIAKKYLKDKGLYNDSWRLYSNLTKKLISTYLNITEYQSYIFRFVPKFHNLTILDPNAQNIWVEIYPDGTIMNLEVNLRRVETISETMNFKWSDPKLALIELDYNFGQYVGEESQYGNVTVHSMELILQISSKDPSELVPVWLVHLDEKNIQVIKIQ